MIRKQSWVWYMMTPGATYLIRNRVPNFSINFSTKERTPHKHLLKDTIRFGDLTKVQTLHMQTKFPKLHLQIKMRINK